MRICDARHYVENDLELIIGVNYWYGLYIVVPKALWWEVIQYRLVIDWFYFLNILFYTLHRIGIRVVPDGAYLLPTSYFSKFMDYVTRI